MDLEQALDPIPIQVLQAIVVALSWTALAWITVLACRTARGSRRLVHWVVLWWALALPVGLAVYVARRKRDPALAHAALRVQIAGIAISALLLWFGAAEG